MSTLYPSVPSSALKGVFLLEGEVNVLKLDETETMEVPDVASALTASYGRKHNLIRAGRDCKSRKEQRKEENFFAFLLPTWVWWTFYKAPS